jgi:hypothetical protein
MHARAAFPVSATVVLGGAKKMKAQVLHACARSVPSGAAALRACPGARAARLWAWGAVQCHADAHPSVTTGACPLLHAAVHVMTQAREG